MVKYGMTPLQASSGTVNAADLIGTRALWLHQGRKSADIIAVAVTPSVTSGSWKTWRS